MSRLTWDAQTTRKYETGIKKCALYPLGASGAYEKGVAWNGITGVTESPSGADLTELWADDIKYLSIRASEKFGGTIEAYMYPDEWAECDGSVELCPGVIAGQQNRKPFGLSYVTTLGNDAQLNDYGYKIHLLYNATVSPSERAYQTINDSPEAITFSWEFDATPVPVSVKVNGKEIKPTAILTIDSSRFIDETAKANFKALEDYIWGTDEREPMLPTPDQVYEILTTGRLA